MNTWFLRKPNGDIFGPVEQVELLRWASTDRIAPDDDVSADRKEWLSAAAMPGLKLDWMIEWPDGHRAGPYHVSSLGEMLAEGELDGNEPVRHIRTKQSATLLQTLQSALLAGELHLAAGTLTAALSGIMRAQTDEALNVANIPVVPPPVVPVPALAAMPVAAPAPLTATPAPPATVPAAKPLKPSKPEHAVRVALPPQKPIIPVPVPAQAPVLMEAAKMLHAVLAGGARTVQELSRQVELLPAGMAQQAAALAAAQEDLRQAHAAQDSQAKLAQQVAAESAQKIQSLQVENAKLHEAFAALQQTQAAEHKTALEAAAAAAAQCAALTRERDAVQNERDANLKKSAELERLCAQQVEAQKKAETQLAEAEKSAGAARTQAEQQSAALHQAHEQLAAVKSQRDAAVKQCADLERERTALRQQCETAIQQATAQERLAAERAQAEAQAHGEAQKAVAARDSALQTLAGVRSELEDTARKLVERDVVLRQAEQKLEKLEERLVAAASALETERKNSVHKLAALQAECDSAVASGKKALTEQQRLAAAAQQAQAEQKRLETELQQGVTNRQQLETELRELRRELESWKQRVHSQPVATSAKPPIGAAAPATPSVKPVPAARPAPSSDLYCLPPRKIRDDF